MGDFLIVDIVSRDELWVTGRLGHPGYATKLLVQDGYVHVSDETIGGVSILDARHTDRLEKVSTLLLPVPMYTSQVALSQDKLYVANAADGFYIADVSDVTNPIVEGHVLPRTLTYGVAARGNLAYLGAVFSGFMIYDCSEPTDPVLLDQHMTDDAALDVVLSGSVAYVADRFAGLKVFDVSEPTNITKIGSFSMPAGPPWIIYLALQDTILYAAGGNTVYVLDVSDPRKPALLSVYESDDVRDIAATERFVLLASRENGLRILDSADPTQLVELAAFPMDEHTLGVGAANGYCYVANYPAGVVRFCIPATTSIQEDSTLISPDSVTAKIGLSNHPNPFNAGTIISYHLATSGRTNLSIYNVLGRRVRSWSMPASRPAATQSPGTGRRLPEKAQRPVCTWPCCGTAARLGDSASSCFDSKSLRSGNTQL